MHTIRRKDTIELFEKWRICNASFVALGDVLQADFYKSIIKNSNYSYIRPRNRDNRYLV